MVSQPASEPALGVVEATDVQHDEGRKLLGFFERSGLTSDGVLPNGLGFGFGAGRVRQVIEAVVGGAAAGGSEVVVALVQAGDETSKGVGALACGGGEALGPGLHAVRRAHLEAGVGAVGRDNLGLEAGLRDLVVQVERVGRVIGGADDAYLHQLQDAAGREVAVLQLAIGFVPDLLGRG
ncbi:MAG: hypothetical protein RJB43_1012, partial [Verrucomicrobiota bacterium]